MRSRVIACGVGLLALVAGTPVMAEDGIVERSKALVEEYSKQPTFIAPGPAFDAKSCMAGKTISVVPLASAVPFVQDILGGMKDAAEKVGFTLQVWENQGQPTQWAAGITNAINTNADLIDMIAGVDPGTVQPQIEQARAAGVAVSTATSTTTARRRTRRYPRMCRTTSPRWRASSRPGPSRRPMARQTCW